MNLNESLKQKIQEKFMWNAEELNEYLTNQHLACYTNCEEALAAFLNVPLHEGEQLYQCITKFPTQDISKLGGFKQWLDHLFQHITTDYGDILELEDQRYYLIFKE